MRLLYLVKHGVIYVAPTIESYKVEHLIDSINYFYVQMEYESEFRLGLF